MNNIREISKLRSDLIKIPKILKMIFFKAVKKVIGMTDT